MLDPNRTGQWVPQSGQKLPESPQKACAQRPLLLQQRHHPLLEQWLNYSAL
ncbi:hypothetical protein QJS10_CPB21g01353 [Acorus calamus]|uniref:Uncharacterized protein n=1 Tax=Acorus calamus TaxID=4465 RepID=A0AAV9C6J9_ACOCL|nr:hypothetical protein QJS10_CPB21g01353 [Acorus calamus]